jgi:hypothetical protein
MTLPAAAESATPSPVEAAALATAIHTRPIPRQTSRRIAVILSAVLAVWASLAVARWYFSAPQRTIDRYFDALADRDFSAAIAQLDRDRVPESDLLGPEALRDPGYSPPRDVHIEEIVGGTNEKKATVSFQLGGDRRTITLDLQRADTTVFWLYHPWRIATVTTLSFAAKRDVTISGVPIHATDGTVNVPALIGQYTIHVPNNPLFKDPSTPIYAGIGRISEVTLSLQDGVESEVSGQIATRIEECTRSHESQPGGGCPFSTYASGYTGRWTVDRQPVIEVTSESDVARVETVEPGHATFSYSDGYDTYESESDIDVSGTVTVSNGELVVELDE